MGVSELFGGKFNRGIVVLYAPKILMQLFSRLKAIFIGPVQSFGASVFDLTLSSLWQLLLLQVMATSNHQTGLFKRVAIQGLVHAGCPVHDLVVYVDGRRDIWLPTRIRQSLSYGSISSPTRSIYRILR